MCRSRHRAELVAVSYLSFLRLNAAQVPTRDAEKKTFLNPTRGCESWSDRTLSSAGWDGLRSHNHNRHTTVLWISWVSNCETVLRKCDINYKPSFGAINGHFFYFWMVQLNLIQKRRNLCLTDEQTEGLRPTRSPSLTRFQTELSKNLPRSKIWAQLKPDEASESILNM